MRVVWPEILDSLAAEHPDAVESRRDLRLINTLMGNFRWIERVLSTHIRPGERILELGAGDGMLGRTVRARFPDLEGRYAALDLAPPPADWPADLDWVQAELFSGEGAAALATAEVVIANLFLHHFAADGLARLGGMLGNVRLLILSEPARRHIHIWEGRLLASVLRLNRVTRHDLPVSVRAGFRGPELPEALLLDRVGWRWQTRSTWLGAYRVVASRARD